MTNSGQYSGGCAPVAFIFAATRNGGKRNAMAAALKML
jgi:hypothetical protein